MRGRTVGILLACGVLALAGGWYFGTARTPAEQENIPRGQLAFPKLAPKLSEAAKIEITHEGGQVVIEKRADGRWGVAELHDYPVQRTKLRAMLTALTELRLAEPRTANPAEFVRLGVEDPSDKGATSDLLQVVDKDDKPIAALIVGHRRVRNEPGLADEIYVRRPGDSQSWLAEGGLVVDADPSQWLDRSVMNIGHDRIASVVVGDGALVFGRPHGKFALTDPADHPKLEGYRVEDVARGLELLSFEQVKADQDVPGTEAGHSVFTTTDGLAVSVRVFQAGADVWARFAASGSGRTKQEADQLNARLHGWTYEIGSWKEKSLVPTLADLLATPPARSAAAQSASAAAAPPDAHGAPAPASSPAPAPAGK